MGNTQARTGRKLQHSLPFLYNYRQLPPPAAPSDDSLVQTLLDNDYASFQQRDELEAFVKRIAEIERDVHGLKSSLSKLESRVESFASKQHHPSKIVKGQEETVLKEMSELKRKLTNLELKLHLDERMKKHEKVVDKLDKSNAAMEKKSAELTAMIIELKSKTMSSMGKSDSAYGDADQAKPEVSDPMNELIGCLVVLIFLISILIGVNL